MLQTAAQKSLLGMNLEAVIGAAGRYPTTHSDIPVHRSGLPLPTAQARTGVVLAPYRLIVAALLLGHDAKHMWQEMDKTEGCIQAFGTSMKTPIPRPGQAPMYY